jgi:hypothetical protein
MGRKTRWQHLPPRTRDFDWGDWQRRHQERLRKDNTLCVLVVKNVRPMRRGDCSAPFILVGTRTRLLDGLYNEYGRAFVGEPVLVTTYDDMDVLQVCVMSSLDRTTIANLASEMGYEGYERWKAQLLAVERDAKFDMPLVWYSETVLAAQVPRRLERFYAAQESRIWREAERLDAAASTKPHGHGGRVPALVPSVHDVAVTR